MGFEPAEDDGWGMNNFFLQVMDSASFLCFKLLSNSILWKVFHLFCSLGSQCHPVHCVLVKMCFNCLKFCWRMSPCLHGGLHFKAISQCKCHLCKLLCHPDNGEWAPSSLLLLLPALERTILCKFLLPHPQLLKLSGGKSVQVLWGELADQMDWVWGFFYYQLLRNICRKLPSTLFGAAFSRNDCQGHPSVASEERGGEEEQQGGVPLAVTGTLSWPWSVLENFPWKGLPWLPHLVPPGLGKSQVFLSQWRWKWGIRMRDGAQGASEQALKLWQFPWPRSNAVFPLVLVFLQFSSPGRVLWHQAAAFSSSSSEMLVNHWFISSWP